MLEKKQRHPKGRADEEVEGKDEEKMDWQEHEEPVPEEQADPQEVPRKGFFYEV